MYVNKLMKGMEHLIQEFGAWLEQGFGWLVDVIVFGCLWGISQISRLVGTQLGGAPILKIVALVLVLLLLLYAFCWVFGSFIGVIRWALDRIAYALGVILFNAAVVSGVFVSAGLVAALARASASRSRLRVWWASLTTLMTRSRP